MSKNLCVFLALALLMGLLPITGFAATASASLEGPDGILPGEAATVVFSLEGSSLYGVSGTLVFDTERLTLTDTQLLAPEGWQVEFNGNYFLAYDNSLNNPITGKTALFALTFVVDPDLVEGTEIEISCRDVIASDADADIQIDPIVYAAVIPAAETETLPTEEVPAETTMPVETTPEITEPEETEPETTVPYTTPTEVPTPTRTESVPTESILPHPSNTQAGTAETRPTETVPSEEPDTASEWQTILIVILCAGAAIALVAWRNRKKRGE